MHPGRFVAALKGPRYITIMLLVFTALIFTASTMAVAQGTPDAAKTPNPVAATTESIAAGKDAYRKCAPCHGSSGQGGAGNDLIPAAPSLVDDQWDHGSTDGAIFDNIKNGVAPDFNMVPFKDQMSDTDIWNVVNYIRYLRTTAKK